MNQVSAALRFRLFRFVFALCVSVSGMGTGAERPSAPVAGLALELPAYLYAVPGIETNLYFDNVVLTINPRNFIFDVTCTKGSQQEERWTFVPADGDVGEYPLRLDVMGPGNQVVASCTTRVRVVPRGAGAGRSASILIVGDSLTAASVYPQQVYDLCQGEANPKLTMVGTTFRGRKAEGPVRHEGYGGWTCQGFATRFLGDEAARTGLGRVNGKPGGSPFIYQGDAGNPELDFERYCREFNGGKSPDFVTFLLGCNDTFSATDESIDERIDGMLKYYDVLIGMVHGLDPKTRVGCLLLVPPAATQDAFGANYRCGQTRWQYKRNQFRVTQRMREHFGGREEEGIFLIPANANLDCVRNYPARESRWNARSETKGSRLNNGVHPAAAGYRQIGDSIYCWLKAMLAE